MASYNERWNHKEIIDFLNICKEKKVFKRMNNKKYRFDKILCDIKADMNCLGYSRTIPQMSLKLKKLRQKYKHCLTPNSTGKNLRRQFPFFEIIDEMEQDRLQETSDNDWELKDKIQEDEDEKFCYDEKSLGVQKNVKEAKREEPEFETNQEIDEEGPISPLPRNNTREGKHNSYMANYTQYFKILVSSFKNAQEDLQTSFFKQQLMLQQQQQEWEEKILDEEREFFAKILNSTKSQYS